MTAQTKAEIRDRAAYELGILPVGQSLEDQHKTLIEQFYDEVYAGLEDEGIAAWASANTVPDAYGYYMVMLVAHRGIGAFGVSGERANRIMLAAGPDGNLAKREIRKVLRPKFEAAELPQDF